MLTVIVPGKDHFNDATQKFVTIGDEVLELEHSLASISKWESEHEIPFLGEDDKTSDQMMSYIRHMTLGPERPKELYDRLTQKNVDAIGTYIDRKMTATWFTDNPNVKGPRASEVVTAELIYYWMVSLQIPFECQHWHLKRLLTLIQVCNLKNQPAKKMPRKEAMSKQRALNQARQAKHNTSG